MAALLGAGGALLVPLAFAPPALARNPMNRGPAAPRISVGTAVADVPPATPPRWGPTASVTPTVAARSPLAVTPSPTAVPGAGVQVIQAPSALGPLAPTLRPAAGGTPSVSPLSGMASASGSARLVPDLPATPAGARVISLAQTFVGARYTWGGTSAATGFDCSGLIYHVFRTLGYAIGRTVEEQFTAGRPVRRDELRPGDLLFYQNTYIRGLSHDGIYLGSGRFVHAVDEASGVAVTALNSAYWEERYLGARRIVD